MKQILKELFSESKSVSMMRVMSLLCCLAAIGIAIVGMCKAVPDYSGITMLVSAFLAAGFTGKVVQKNIEVSNNSNS
jgi:hypothetical protein